MEQSSFRLAMESLCAWTIFAPHAQGLFCGCVRKNLGLGWPCDDPKVVETHTNLVDNAHPEPTAEGSTFNLSALAWVMRMGPHAAAVCCLLVPLVWIAAAAAAAAAAAWSRLLGEERGK